MAGFLFHFCRFVEYQPLRVFSTKGLLQLQPYTAAFFLAGKMYVGKTLS